VQNIKSQCTGKVGHDRPCWSFDELLMSCCCALLSCDVCGESSAPPLLLALKFSYEFHNRSKPRPVTWLDAPRQPITSSAPSSAAHRQTDNTSYKHNHWQLLLDRAAIRRMLLKWPFRSLPASGFLLVFNSNRSCTGRPLGAWDRQTDERTDGS